MDGEIFWERAIPLIKAHKLTYKQYAEELGVSLNTFYGWIKFKRIPHISVAYMFAVTLGVTLDYLLGGSETDITKARYKELEARRSAAEAIKMAKLILEEMQKIRPLEKQVS